MLHHKTHYPGLKYSGYAWAGWWKGKHHFSRKEIKGYSHIKATEEDLTNGNIEFMCENGFSNENKPSKNEQKEKLAAVFSKLIRKGNNRQNFS